MTSFLSKIRKEHFVLLAIVMVLIALRAPALSMPYYQDENDWAAIVAEGSEFAGRIPHPPLSEAIYIATDRVFGNENLRITPFLLSIVNVFLIYALVRYRFGVRAALWSAFLFAVSFFSLLASVMVDTDGQVLPALFLVAALGYYRFKDAQTLRGRWVWGAIFGAALLAGFLTKLSFVIPAGAFVLDFLYANRARLNLRTLAAYGVRALGLCVGLGVLLLLSQYLFPQFSFDSMTKYAAHFLVLADRNIFQTLIQAMKAVMFVSPFLIALPFFLDKENRSKVMLFSIFLVLGLVFYLVLFDFSGAALDRYLQFVIVPLSVMGGVAIASVLVQDPRVVRIHVWLTSVIAGLVLVFVQFLPHDVLALHPKAAWLERVMRGAWDFLFPFTGGSGPIGFYVSFSMIGLAFLLSGIVVVVTLLKRSAFSQKTALLLLAGIGLMYNATFIEEYLVGAVNGSARTVLTSALAYIEKTPDITKVITYNDSGMYDLARMGKYERRLYADPAFEESYVSVLSEFGGHVLVVDAPPMNPESMYGKYLSTCEAVFEDVSKRITARVYDCEGAVLER